MSGKGENYNREVKVRAGLGSIPKKTRQQLTKELKHNNQVMFFEYMFMAFLSILVVAVLWDMVSRVVWDLGDALALLFYPSGNYPLLFPDLMVFLFCLILFMVLFAIAYKVLRKHDKKVEDLFF